MVQWIANADLIIGEAIMYTVAICCIGVALSLVSAWYSEMSPGQRRAIWERVRTAITGLTIVLCVLWYGYIWVLCWFVLDVKF